MFSLRTKLDDGRPPLVLVFELDGPWDVRNDRAVDVVPFESDFCGKFSIIFAVDDSGSSCRGFLRRAAVAAFCFAARAGGSSRTCSYSLRILAARLTRSARKRGSSGESLKYGAGDV